MRRRLLNLLTLLSLLLCVAVAALGVRSYWADAPDRLDLGSSSSSPFLVSSGGSLGWNYWSDGRFTSSARDWDFLGFSCYRAGVGGQTLTEWRVPYWFLTTTAAILPAARGWRWFRSMNRARRHLCPACGYDLRATPGRCPECGEATKA
jgi:hypothetical protein